MPFQLPDGRQVSADMPFELGEIQYSSNWLRRASKEEKDALGITWIDPVPEAPPPVSIPGSVTPYQARVAITNAGLREQVEAIVAQADQATKDAWEYGISVDRHSPMIEALAGAVGLTSEQIDNLFIEAGKVV